MRPLRNISFRWRTGIAVLLLVLATVLLFGALPNLESVLASQLPWDKKLNPVGADDSFGNSVSVSGDIAIVGGYLADTAGTDAGAAYVFDRNNIVLGSPWGQIKQLTASDAQAGHQFGYSVAVSGDTAIVGMWDNLGSDSGAYVFQQDHGGTDNWGEVKKLLPSDSLGGDRFGFSVSISGDTIVVGARGQDGVVGNAGAAYVFRRDEGGADNWGEVKKLTASDGEGYDFFGQSVAVDGDTAIVGAHGEDGSGFAVGAAYVFQEDEGGAGNWGEVKKLNASNNESFDNFGFNVAVSGDTALVGMSDSLAPKVGEVYVFQQDHGGTGNWGEVRRLAAPDNNAFFGQFLALNGSTAVIHDAGGARVHRQHAGGANNWGEIEQLSTSSSVAISGTTVLTGGGGDGYIYELPPKFTPTPCAPEGCPTPTPTVTPTFTPTPPPGVTKLIASDAGPYGKFSSRNVAVDGDIAAVGGSDTFSGSLRGVYVFNRNQGGAGNWGEIKKVDSPSGQLADGFGTSVSVSGDTMVTGTHGESGGTGLINAGAAYIFQRDAGGPDNWGQVKRLTSSNPEYLGWFGYDVSISGDVVIVGAFGESVGGEDTGAAYIFHRNAGGADNWGQVKRLAASDKGPSSDFGWDVAVSGDAVIVGGRRDINRSAYVFERNAGGDDNWGEVKRLTGGGVGYGKTVAISGDTAIVGAEWSSGKAYVYERYEGGKSNWGQVATLRASDASSVLYFGSSVAISGVTAIVGASGIDGAHPREGAAYVFQRDEGGAGIWGEVTKLTAYDAAVDDEFGDSVGISGNTIVVGAHLEDQESIEAGAAYVFDLMLPMPTPKITPTPTITPTPAPPTATFTPEPDTDGDGCSDLRENGTDEMLGGMRDWQNPWDFYDVLGQGGGAKDGIIDLPNDVLGVIQRFSPAGAPPYDVQFDRGPSSGPNVWNMTAPDGVIDLPNDILGVIHQFAHSCQEGEPAG